MKFFLLFGLFPKEMKKDIMKNSNGVIQFAADSLQWSILDGLYSIKKEIEIINLPYIGSYPLRYKKNFFPQSEFIVDNNKIGYSIGFNNITILKNYSRYVKAREKMFEIIKNVDEEVVILIYAVHLPFIKSAIDIKQKYSNVRICLIIPDLPEFMSSSRNVFYRFLKYVESVFLKKSYSNIDSYIFLTKSMSDKIPVKNKKWMVLEGVYNSTINTDIKIRFQNKDKVIFYSGTLARRYGVIDLVKAFILLKDKEYKLFICGDGDSRDEILKYSKKYNSVFYMGQLPREEVLLLQKKAYILVNPRKPEGEYTKYSFPSKIMEYLASGTPTLMYKLGGIPEEYYNYCYIIDSESVLGLSNSLDILLKKDPNELYELGKKARAFILENKSSERQASKIINFLNS